MPTRAKARIVKKARKLIENPSDWTQASYMSVYPDRSRSNFKRTTTKVDKTGKNCLCVRTAVHSSLIGEDMRYINTPYFGDSCDEMSVSADLCRFGMENGFIRPRQMDSNDDGFAQMLAQWQDMASRKHSDVLALMDAYVAAAPR